MHSNPSKWKIVKKIFLLALSILLFGCVGAICWAFTIVCLDFYVSDEYTTYVLLGSLLCIMIPIAIGLYIVTSKILGED